MRTRAMEMRRTGLVAAVAACAGLLGACADRAPAGPEAEARLHGTTVGTAGSTDAGDAAGGRGFDRSGPFRAVAYINPDIGAATENATVRPSSACERPDRQDRQSLSAVGTAGRNVHVDACLLADREGTLFDGPATFESHGVGVISACPDPDGAGPKTAVLSADRTRCTQTGFQSRGVAGDGEFHARFNNTSAFGGEGVQRIVWCYDPELNGCSDAKLRSVVTINWRS